tara:strand:- start:2294 stop:3295 length:1002 start_codon:yes stop_codon:yes gene_type:complete
MIGKINVAVIGVGAMGKNHARVYSELENSNLVAVCDNDKGIGKEIASKFNTKFYSNVKEMLDNEKIDAVSICLPTKLHKETALTIINKKIHVLVEKPIATTTEEAKEIINEAKKNNVKLMVGHIERFNPIIIELKKRIKNNEIGKIFLIKSERFSPFPKRVIDVGVTVDLSVHDIDIMQYLLESKVKSVYCVNSQKVHSSHEDLMTSILKFKNDTVGTTSCNWITAKIVREITVIGEKGMFKANYLTQELNFFKNEFTDKYIDWEKRRLNVIPGDTIKIDIEKKEPLKNELQSFVDCIMNDSTPAISGQDGLESLNVALKFLESSKNNEVMDL